MCIYNIIRKKKKITASCILYIQCIDLASSLICSLFKRWIFAVQQNYTGLNHSVLYRLQAGSELMNSIYFFSFSYWVIKCTAVYQLFITAGRIAPALTFSVRCWIMCLGLTDYISWVEKWHLHKIIIIQSNGKFHLWALNFPVQTALGITINIKIKIDYSMEYWSIYSK